MRRPDAIGMFWEDIEIVKVKKAPPPKPTPPPRTWEEPGFLPEVTEDPRIRWANDLTSLDRAKEEGHYLIVDTETYPNYFLIQFYDPADNLIYSFDTEDNDDAQRPIVKWILENFLTVGFNTLKFDNCIAALYVNGFGAEELFEAAKELTAFDVRPYLVLKQRKVKDLKLNCIDLIEVCPLQASLKIYAGRLHGKRLQDLPFKVGTVLTPEQKQVVKHYCANDLFSTFDVLTACREVLELRTLMSQKYGVDLRSKSDAQIAEAVIAHEYARICGIRPMRPQVQPGARFKYKMPEYLQYRTPVLQNVHRVVSDTWFTIDEEGGVAGFEPLKELQIELGFTKYQMGIGGLHSQESEIQVFADGTHLIVDKDVASYYPSIILNQGLYPKHLGKPFLMIYQQIVTDRLKAKKEKIKTVADTLKIVINGSFGKLGSKWSILYSPDLLIQVTLTGQLTLLLLIETLELAGFPIVSANTDGIVIYPERSRLEEMNAIVANWENTTKFITEETRYLGLFSRDVNNYIAVKEDLSTKRKGEYSNPWADQKTIMERFHKNPANLVCVEAITAFLTHGTPIEQTIHSCTDLTKFITIRTVKGGAWQNGVFLGKSIRWYYSTEKLPPIIYADSGNKVPKTTGAKPMMDLPEVFPSDLDYSWYIQETTSMLWDLGFPRPPKIKKQKPNATP